MGKVDAHDEIRAARRRVKSMDASVAFTLSPVGLLRREDLEIAYADEIRHLRLVVRQAREALEGGDEPGAHLILKNALETRP